MPVKKKKKLQVAIGHDHTASMGGLRVQVRRNNCATIRELQKFCDRNGIELEIGVVSIMDLHDEPGGRDMLGLPFTRDIAAVSRHIMTVPDARGNSSGEECYERFFHLLRSWDWDPDAMKIVVFTGDSEPHSRNHRKNPEGLDCLDEASALVKEHDVRIQPIKALTFSNPFGAFWKQLAKIGKGVEDIELDQFDHITTLLLGILAREIGTFDTWEKELSSASPVSYAVQRSLDRLAGRGPRKFSSRNAARSQASDGRFQVYTIEDKIPAREFFRDIGVISDLDEYGSHKGELFYAHEVRASEELRPNHEVIVEDDKSGEKIMGEDARDMIGIPYGTTGQKVKRNQLKDEGYTIWIQSKSVGNSRHLERGQRVMVDLDPKAGFGSRLATAGR